MSSACGVSMRPARSSSAGAPGVSRGSGRRALIVPIAVNCQYAPFISKAHGSVQPTGVGSDDWCSEYRVADDAEIVPAGRWFGGDDVDVVHGRVGVGGGATPRRRGAHHRTAVARPLLSHLPQHTVADRRSGARHRRCVRRRRPSGDLGEGGPEAAGRRDASGRPAAAGLGHLRGVHHMARDRARPRSRRTTEPGPDRHVPPSQPQRIPQRHP